MTFYAFIWLIVKKIENILTVRLNKFFYKGQVSLIEDQLEKKVIISLKKLSIQKWIVKTSTLS